MGDRNLTAYPDNKFTSTTVADRKTKYPPPIQKPIEQVISSFTALDVVSLAGEMFEDSGLLMKGNVLHDLYDPSFVNPESDMIFENQGDTNIEEFDYKSLSYEEKKLLLRRLMEAKEKGFSPQKSGENSSKSLSKEKSPETPRLKTKKRSNEEKNHDKKKSPSRRRRKHSTTPRRSRSRSSTPCSSRYKKRHYVHKASRNSPRRRS
ncbi:hypothetical protein MXB_1153 [Myxobolus squamalis]|nr:hypothetical protein MXB_1153 [Myxobolus squamalis]